MSYKLAVAIFFDIRDCKPLKKYRNNQYSYSSCALYYFFSLGGRRGGGRLFEVGHLKSTFWGWALIRGWALINFFYPQGGRLFEIGRLIE